MASAVVVEPEKKSTKKIDRMKVFFFLPSFSLVYIIYTARIRRCRPLCTAGCFCHACYVS